MELQVVPVIIFYSCIAEWSREKDIMKIQKQMKKDSISTILPLL